VRPRAPASMRRSTAATICCCNAATSPARLARGTLHSTARAKSPRAMFDQVFANLATGFAYTFGAPFIDATAVWPGTPVKDAGGSITSPGTPVSLSCKVQFDDASLAMRSAPDFLQTDVRILVLSASLDAPL